AIVRGGAVRAQGPIEAVMGDETLEDVFMDVMADGAGEGR
ncbi:ABC transporter ATP-binding protein, partial [Atopobiaceae bacterium FL090493]|nr:ABC transporter ATP-binding protein [Atopobiaceae bacterium FL090493]